MHQFPSICFLPCVGEVVAGSGGGNEGGTLAGVKGVEGGGGKGNRGDQELT